MEISNLQALNVQNIPGNKTATASQGDEFSQVFFKVMGLINEVEDFTMDSELIELITPVTINEETQEDQENILFNPMNVPWILMNNNEIAAELSAQSQESDQSVPLNNIDIMDTNPISNMDSVKNINPELITETESVVDISKDLALDVENKNTSFDKILQDETIPKINIQSNTKQPSFQEISSETTEEISSKLEPISIENEFTSKHDLVLSSKKDNDINLADKEEIDFDKAHIQSLTTSRINPNELNIEVTELTNIDFDQNIQNVNDAIIELIDLRTQDGDNTMKVKLFPEELGNIDITLKMEEGKLVARILVENEQVRELFNNHINQLNSKLIRQDISLERVSVELNLNSNNQSSSKNNQNQNRNPFKHNKGISAMENIQSIKLNQDHIYGSNGLDILA